MKIPIKFLVSLILATGLLAGSTLLASDGKDHTKDITSANVTKEPMAAYPLDTCVVSGEKLGGEMGPPIEYVHKEAGKPDRVVRLCCKKCIPDFKKDPAKYLEMIDNAAAGKPQPPKSDANPTHKH